MALRAQSQRPSSSSVSSRRPRAGLISTSSPGVRASAPTVPRDAKRRQSRPSNAYARNAIARSRAVFYHSVVDETEPKQFSGMLWPMAVQMRPSQALRLWQQVALAEVRADVPDLSMRQIAILLIIYLDPPPHT